MRPFIECTKEGNNTRKKEISWREGRKNLEIEGRVKKQSQIVFLT
jgi:hypothetical protein